jgi:hypothetical protein
VEIPNAAVAVHVEPGSAESRGPSGSRGTTAGAVVDTAASSQAVELPGLNSRSAPAGFVSGGDISERAVPVSGSEKSVDVRVKVRSFSLSSCSYCCPCVCECVMVCPAYHNDFCDYRRDTNLTLVCPAAIGQLAFYGGSANYFSAAYPGGGLCGIGCCSERVLHSITG